MKRIGSAYSEPNATRTPVGVAVAASHQSPSGNSAPMAIVCADADEGTVHDEVDGTVFAGHRTQPWVVVVSFGDGVEPRCLAGGQPKRGPPSADGAGPELGVALERLRHDDDERSVRLPKGS